MVTLVRPVQPEKALILMTVTLFGMVMPTRPVQSEKTTISMSVTLFGMVTLVRPVQPEKALSPMLVTLFGIVGLTKYKAIAAGIAFFQSAKVFPCKGPNYSLRYITRHSAALPVGLF